MEHLPAIMNLLTRYKVHMTNEILIKVDYYLLNAVQMVPKQRLGLSQSNFFRLTLSLVYYKPIQTKTLVAMIEQFVAMSDN